MGQILREDLRPTRAEGWRPGRPRFSYPKGLGGQDVVVVPAFSRSHPCCSRYQEPLSINQQKRIMEEARSVNALSKTLATLKVAAEFLAVTGGQPECPLPEYVRQELKMDAAAKQFQDLPVSEGVGGKHGHS